MHVSSAHFDQRLPCILLASRIREENQETANNAGCHASRALRSRSIACANIRPKHKSPIGIAPTYDQDDTAQQIALRNCLQLPMINTHCIGIRVMPSQRVANVQLPILPNVRRSSELDEPNLGLGCKRSTMGSDNYARSPHHMPTTRRLNIRGTVTTMRRSYYGNGVYKL